MDSGIITSPHEMEYTFDNFDVDRRNYFAYLAAKEISETTEALYNPFFIYGGKYDGKTHLLKAMENELCQNYKELKVIYTTATDYCNEMIEAIQMDKMDVFRKKYRMADVFLMDDLERLEGLKLIQSEFFWTFEELYLKRKQIIFSADRHPRGLVSLDSLFRKRLEMGLVIGLRS
ncbi:DnaA ATPase domain-containing protein [Butyrivibrio sp. AD3002]|uniref:DnaA ATPase domain-containing protein n=1 Tax=Butyrivibrio sp. AD3002 TaxID=1280670 RepID=UPI0003B5BCC7|nr:DnaA/Hda family protein [Butyrivibrio sp. AD3002]